MLKPCVTLIAIVAIGTMTASESHAQLRPLEPAQWSLITDKAKILGQVGASRLLGQRASLAGTRGDLVEIGNFALAWRTGRIVLEAAGTVRRSFRETETFDDLYPDVEPGDGRRHDSGDYRVSTTVKLTPQAWPIVGILRFGTRLPTTDNTKGLDRDAIDFFSTIGAAGSMGRISLEAETGLGIYTSREQRFEQDDLFLYAVKTELKGFRITPSIAAVGQLHGATHSAIRGLENLGELRAGLRVGFRRWVRIDIVRGYETFSPSSGVIVSAGSRY